MAPPRTLFRPHPPLTAHASGWSTRVHGVCGWGGGAGAGRQIEFSTLRSEHVMQKTLCVLSY